MIGDFISLFVCFERGPRVAGCSTVLRRSGCVEGVWLVFLLDSRDLRWMGGGGRDGPVWGCEKWDVSRLREG